MNAVVRMIKPDIMLHIKADDRHKEEKFRSLQIWSELRLTVLILTTLEILCLQNPRAHNLQLNLLLCKCRMSIKMDRYNKYYN